MKVLIRRKRSVEHLLFGLPAKTIINEVIGYINKGRYDAAIKVVEKDGILIDKIKDEELIHISANLILTNNRAHFDLMVD